MGINVAKGLLVLLLGWVFFFLWWFFSYFLLPEWGENFIRHLYTRFLYSHWEVFLHHNGKYVKIPQCDDNQRNIHLNLCLLWELAMQVSHSILLWCFRFSKLWGNFSYYHMGSFDVKPCNLQCIYMGRRSLSDRFKNIRKLS